MKKFIAYLICVIFTFGMCWFGVITMSMPYGNERAPYAFGALVCFAVAILLAGYVNSRQWNGKKKGKE